MDGLKLLLFDFDGVVTDNSEGIFNCIRYACSRLGFPAPAGETLCAFVGPPLYESFVKYTGADHESALKLVEAYRERYRPLGTKEAVLYPDMAKALSALKAKGYVLAVCSGKPREFVMTIAGNLGVYELFSEYYCSSFSDVHVSKAEYIARAMRDFGAAKDETLMIGDTPGDIAAAKQAGVKSLGALYGFAEPGAMETCGADLLAADVGELYRLIAGEDLP